MISYAMPIYNRFYCPCELQFLTASTYRRTPLFFLDRFKRCFVQRLDEVRQELHFLLVGWILMPERFHVLIRPYGQDASILRIDRLR